MTPALMVALGILLLYFLITGKAVKIAKAITG